MSTRHNGGTTLYNNLSNRTATHNIATFLAVSGLVLLCINPGLTQGEDNKNLLLCVVMCLSPGILMLREARVIIPRIDLPLGMVCALVIAFPVIFHPESVRWITMLFTCACCVYFMMFTRVVRIASLSPRSLSMTVKGIVYAFTVVLLIQQLCVLTGLPTFMPAMVYPEHPWKLNSLTAEPSHTSVTLCMAMFTFTQTCRTVRPDETLWDNMRHNPALWICWAWVIFSTENASAFILSPLVITPYITRRNIYIWGTIFLISGGVIFFTPVKHIHQLERIIVTAEALTTFDEQAMIEADESAAARIVPTFRGEKALADSPCMEIIIGHGTDADQRDLAPRPCDKKGRGFAGIFCMNYNYGLLCAVAFWSAIGAVTLTRRRWTTALTFLFAIQMSADFNMQLVWMIMAFALIYKYNVCNRHELLSTSWRNINERERIQTPLKAI